MTDFKRYLTDRATAQISGEWRKGPCITFENLVDGKGAVQHISVDEFFGRVKTPEKPSKPAGQVMTFGKHKGKLLIEVKEEDPNYWSWALENVGFFAAVVKKAGLDD